MNRLHALATVSHLFDAGRLQIPPRTIHIEGQPVDVRLEYVVALAALSGQLLQCTSIDDLKAAVGAGAAACMQGKIKIAALRREIRDIIDEVDQFGRDATKAARLN